MLFSVTLDLYGSHSTMNWMELSVCFFAFHKEGGGMLCHLPLTKWLGWIITCCSQCAWLMTWEPRCVPCLFFPLLIYFPRSIAILGSFSIYIEARLPSIDNFDEDFNNLIEFLASLIEFEQLWLFWLIWHLPILRVVLFVEFFPKRLPMADMFSFYLVSFSQGAITNLEHDFLVQYVMSK